MTRPTDTELLDSEQVLTIAAGVIAVACVMVWTAGQLAARIWAGEWPPASLLDSPHILIRVIGQREIRAAPGRPRPPS